jgi:putative transcriptional regulator
MIIYKDILTKLKDSGYNTSRLRREKIISESTITRIRNGEPIKTDTLGLICELTGLEVSDLIEFKK